MEAQNQNGKCAVFEEQLVLLAYGELPDEDRHTLERHAADCPRCAAELANVKALQTLMTSAPVIEPTASLLARARMGLDEALDRTPPVGGVGRLRQWLRTGTFHLRATPALASLLLVFGFAGGGFTGMHFARTGLGAPGADNGAGARNGSGASAGQAIPQGIANISGVTEQPGSNLVQVHYNQIVPGSIEADASDPRIQQLLLLAAQNRANPGVRVDSVGLLADQCRAGRDCNPGNVRQVLMTSLRYDKNAGVRLKALDGLAPYVGDDQAVRDSVLDALLHDDNPGVRTQAIQMLSPLEADGSVRQALHTLASDDRNPYIRTVSQQTLEQAPEIQ